MSKTKIALTGMAALSVLTLAACSNGNSSSSNKMVKLPQAYKNSKSAIKGGTLKVAEVNDAPFQGITDPALASNAEDTDVFAPEIQDLFNNDSHYKFKNGGPANFKLDKSAKTITVTLRNNLKWSDGKPVTAKDVEYAQEVVASPDSTSQQYSDSMSQIVGMDEFHAGKSKTISGIDMPDGENGKKVVFHFKQMSPGMQYGGSGFIWEYAEPYHQIKDIPIAKLASSAQVRKNPLSYGPFKLKKVVAGESTSFVPNKYYWGSKPKTSGVTVQVVSTSAIEQALKSHKYDLTVGGLPTSKYPQIKKISGYTTTGTPSRSFGYFGFNLGHFDTKTAENVMDSSKKMSNVKLRQAMAYAINQDEVSKKFGNGLSERATTLVPRFFTQFHDNSNNGYPLNIKKANKLLDEAGYKKKGKWRQTPDGKPLVINFAAMKGSDTVQAEEDDYLQQWHKVGLDVKYVNNKPMEMNSFYSMLQAPSSNKFDIYLAAWQFATEPSPQQTYGKSAQFNMGHFVTAKNTELINKIDSPKSFDTSYRKQQFKAWQTYMTKEAAYLPQSEGTDYSPVNNRVKNFTNDPAHTNTQYAELALTSNSTATK
ncbi:oligopeptide ABC transporter substrate-binding protein [Furfurilactobacillus rossiae]|uniref:ABC transporter, substrate-binding protein, family 5 n=1 Tax=Furfurilactobacillus rossiae DSM 15814 TaxID=1114972 RepID=A0A0R1RGG1_9LACO|nr:oligopeptide ABC transporter substrate-binding protein [Furfurilactobacillus rossiae]KRL52739.1 ABC transporter, substrate-binding protein, family 5 [Furfurilactobacillus rossiae DSM 15814]QFR66673.1 oligopeptide ABC transporter substrate-binding protein [Furfurilactobacillus rossiae]QLE62148.1 Oligopeptide ABC transporter periplasmic oligopeptide-binding protein OppA [Furfurilactobacillus rossiae]